MQKKTLSGVVVLILFSINVLLSDIGFEVGRITFMLGGADQIQVQHKDDSLWNAAKLNNPVYEGDIVKTSQECRCEVRLNDGGIVRIGEKSVFQFTSAALQKNQNAKSELKQGQVWANLSHRKSKQKGFQIKTPTAVCAVRGTIYRIDADTSTACLVYDGAVDVGPTSFWGQPIKRTGKSLEPQQVPRPRQVPGPYQVSLDEWIQIVKGFQINVRADGKYEKKKFDEKKDAQLEWVQWNQDLDKAVQE
jgi:hypothetical protein